MTYTERLLEMRDAIAAELDHGADRDEVIARLDAERHALADQGRTADADLLTDLLDFLTGWCNPAVAL